MHLARTAFTRGKVPSLPVLAKNPAASLYASLGFRERRNLWLLERRRTEGVEGNRRGPAGFPLLMPFPPLERFGLSAARHLASARAPSSLAIDTPCGLVRRLGTLLERGATRARARLVGRSLNGSLALGLFSLRGSSSRAPHGPATPRPVIGSPSPEIPLAPRVGWFPRDRDVFPSPAACRRIPGRGLGESGSGAGFFGADLVQRGEEIP